MTVKDQWDEAVTGMERVTGREQEPISETAAGESGKKEKKVFEAGGIVVCDGKVVLRLTDEQRWIFPKGKLKKHETPVDAAVREVVEETGLTVEVIGEAGEFVKKFDGKKRRFVFYLMRATGKTWDWPHHEGRDTFLIDPDRVASMLAHKGYGSLWAACHERVRALCREEAPPA